jgi:hypothetical protein
MGSSPDPDRSGCLHAAWSRSVTVVWRVSGAPMRFAAPSANRCTTGTSLTELVEPREAPKSI